MKTMILLFSLLTSSLALAKQPVESCLKDKLTYDQIAEIPANERMDVLNSDGEMVGAIFLTGADTIDSLYLCGGNSGYYYVNAQLSDWLNESKRALTQSEIINDEYDAVGSVQTIRQNGTRMIVLDLSIRFAGSPDDADYDAFSTQVFIPVK